MFEQRNQVVDGAGGNVPLFAQRLRCVRGCVEVVDLNVPEPVGMTKGRRPRYRFDLEAGEGQRGMDSAQRGGSQ